MEKLDPLFELAVLGGPVVVGLVALSVLTLALVFYKTWQLAASGVGRHSALKAALEVWRQGKKDEGRSLAKAASGYLPAIISQAMLEQDAQSLRKRLDAELDMAFHRLSRGFRLMDTIAQIAPLLGLFGTVLGMIEAFQALQNAGAAVDPSLLAGGIWVALLTTAVGLAVAMPTSVLLSWFDSRMEQERVFAELALTTVLSPSASPAVETNNETRHVA